jgi:NAD(P)-dependent dehydrogenase (short-subunit alcohol dehydrogenase family)
MSAFFLPAELDINNCFGLMFNLCDNNYRGNMNKVYIITGATGGMGVDIARRLVNAGKVVLFDLNASKLAVLQKKLGANAFCIAGDIRNKFDIVKVRDLAGKHGVLAGVVNLAGVAGDFGDAKGVLEINLVGTALLMQELLPIVTKNTVFINTASLAAYLTPYTKETSDILVKPLEKDFIEKIMPFTQNNPGYAYSLSKQGVILYTKSQTKAFSEKGARILSVSPGTIQTPMLDRSIEISPDAVNGLIAATPVGRVGQPEDISNLILFLLSAGASFISGTDILIDGGVASAMGV